ncbi:PTS glucose transporter subunit IIA [Lacticaseibacillus sp. 53-4]|uniref:PTS sugar transporter subunit IIA n=1 Tax=Lacticaseibacillus sp. 53-4 TaxID=2799575 RepID=UPI001943AC62|nr:PTS glucose transporter subunit IIA [Lacticaseibacillus sp. 53-4]
MLNIFKKKVTDATLVAPVTGNAVTLSEVPDKVFASGMMGKGLAFNFTGDTVYAPADGKITMMPTTKHAFGITTANGSEILVHIGIDTVNLKGSGFRALAKADDKVHAGDPIIQLDRAAIEKEGYNLITMLLVTNSADLDVTVNDVKEVKAGETAVVSTKKS